MSFNDIVGKLVESMKTEINKPEHMDKITNEIIHPIVSRVLENLYPYLLGFMGISTLVIMMIIIILFLNIRICYRQ